MLASPPKPSQTASAPNPSHSALGRHSTASTSKELPHSVTHISQPTTTPSYGEAAQAESGAFGYDDEYYDEEDFELEEELARLDEEAFSDDDGAYDFFAPTMTEAWPAAVPNRLGEGYTRPDGVERKLENPDDPRLSSLGSQLALPYEVETLAEMDDKLDYICSRLVECVRAREFNVGFRVWDGALSIWQTMGYPMQKDVKIKLIFLYYELLFIPGASSGFIDDMAAQLQILISDRLLSISDFRIPWRPLYDALYLELFPHPNKLSRHTENVAPTLLNVAEEAQRFFHPDDVDEMLEVIIPELKPNMDSILATQAFLVHFLPISSCQKWLPLVFRLWYGLNSGYWDDQASDLMGQLAIAHVDPSRSDPSIMASIPRGRLNTPEEQAVNPNTKKRLRNHLQRQLEVAGEVEEDADGLNYWARPELLPAEVKLGDPNWQGIRKDVGIFTDREFEFLMTKTLRSLNVPVGGELASQNSMSVTWADARASKKILDAKKPIDRVQSLAETIIFSMSEDAPPTSSGSASGIATPDPSSKKKSALTRVQLHEEMKRSGSTDSLAAAGQKGEENKRFLAGSKAMDHLSRLLTSCETFFHPSNSGHWSIFLNTFISHLTSNFVERWKAEEQPDCRTPVSWRLTAAIKREFVLCIRPLALASIFNKDMKAVSPAVGTLKKLALLEPDLIMPAVMERAVPSLQGLEETARTPAVTFALAALAEPLTARQIWRMGGIYPADLFALLLPGIDLNDPSKTGLACMAISNMVDFLHMSDIADVEPSEAGAIPGARALRKVERDPVEDDPNDPVQQEMEDLEPEDVNARLRYATAAFRDWVPEFLGRVLLLFANLPEEGGKSGRAGGKVEMLTLQSVLHACGGVFASLDDKLFDIALEQIVEYATSTCRSNAVDAVGELVRNLASANAPKVFAKFFPICKHRIESELKSGASSMRTTTTSIPLPSDATLHWWQSITVGMLIPGRVILSDPEVRSQYIELLQIMVNSAYSERGWQWSGKIMEKTMSSLTSVYFKEMRAFNPDVYASEDFKTNHVLYWGKLYRPSEIQLQWRVPDARDIEMAFDVLGIADNAVQKITALLGEKDYGDKVWVNEFCRATNVVDKVLRGSYNLLLEVQARKTEGMKAPSFYPPELSKNLPTYKSGLILNDPNDPRYTQVEAFRHRIGETLSRAAAAMRTAGQSDNSVDAVKILVTTIGTYLTAYGVRAKQYSGSQTALDGMIGTKKLVEGQRKHHRTIFLASAAINHQTRLTTLAYNRERSELDDKLIVNLLDFCLSPFVRVRRSAQSTIDAVGKLYRGTWVLCFPQLFDALKPGTDPDVMKGALYTLRYSTMGIARIARDWRQLLTLTELLLGAHHENKASIQGLVHKAADELIAQIQEPVCFDMDVRLDKVYTAADELETLIAHKPSQETVAKIREGTIARLAHQDEQWDIFVNRVGAVARDTTLNWRYVLWASRCLLAAERRDRPTDLRLTEFFMESIQNVHPRIRDYGIVGATRLLYQIAIRSLVNNSDELLFLEEPIDVYSRELELTDTSPEFTRRYLSSFREDFEDESTVVLQDRLESGWLAWGKKIEVTRFTGWDEPRFPIEERCMPGVEMIEGIISRDGWWQELTDHWARENERNYPSATHIDFILATSQIYGLSVFHSLKPIIEGYLEEMESTKVYDRHKMRAMWEILAGLLRGMIEWSGRDRKEFWDWFTPRLPELYANVRHDTTKCWDISIEYVLLDADPRRFKPIVDFCIKTALNADFESGTAFHLSRTVQLVRSVVRCLQWRFNAWADDFAALYFKTVECPYAEVRNLTSAMLNVIDQIKFHPSYPTATALTAETLADPNDEKDIMHLRSGLFESAFSAAMSKLPELKESRSSGAKAVLSTHDNVALSVLAWLTVELSDVHGVAAFPYIIPVLPEIFALRELNDNIELAKMAGKLLVMITSITPALDLIDPLISRLTDILQSSSSWRTRIHVMPVLSLVYFRNLSLLSEPCKARCLDVVAACLRDENQEVREMASATLSGFLRCSQRAMVVVLKDRFTREIRSITLPKRRDAPGQVNPDYQAKIIQLHGAVLGATALVEAFPYTVPKFIPKLLADVLAPRVSDPAPISTTIRSCVASFKRTHEKYQDKFTEDELASMNYAQAGESYYA
ncbi:hypothetical protein IAT38_003199 [Cryptococcus sp. DSM 104549]